MQKEAAGEEKEVKEGNEADFEQIKKDTHQRARRIVSRFQFRFEILNDICRDAEFPSVNASSQTSTLR